VRFIEVIKMPRNVTGGKNFKKFKTGSEGFRAKAAREAADEIVDYVRKSELRGDSPKILADISEAKDALKYMLVGRVIKRFGNGRNEVYCHDGNVRQCLIRGLLRKKGQVFIDVGSLVVVSLREPLSSSSEDEGGLGKSAITDSGTSDIIGLLDEKHVAVLRTTGINKHVFSDQANDTEDIFDRSDQVNAFIDSKKAEEEVNLEDL
jgi:translation initiation factor IF-1